MAVGLRTTHKSYSLALTINNQPEDTGTLGEYSIIGTIGGVFSELMEVNASSNTFFYTLDSQATPTINATLSPVPVPGAFLLFFISILGLLGYSRKGAKLI